MSGIYIHVPYCKKACHYCNFHFSTTKYNMSEMLDCIEMEAFLRKNELHENVDTIYFGGGTPSIIPAERLAIIIQKIKNYFSVSENAEITIEANPDDIDWENLQIWKSGGVNRLSIGVQSFHQKDLDWMNRAHDAEQALQSIVLAQKYGFCNISTDLIYGTPFLTDALWQENLDKIIELNIPHLSAYALTVEPRTALYKMIEKHKIPPVNTENQMHQFDLLMNWAMENDFEHYEISNFAKPASRSRHNNSYWQGRPYLGLGPAAHSYDGHSRQWNIPNNPLYIQSVQKGELNFEREILTRENKINEAIMLSLRTIEGLDLMYIEKDFGVGERCRIENRSVEFIKKRHLFKKDAHLILTQEGKHYADGIASAMFL